MKPMTLAQKLKNPGTRSKVPTSQLPAKYKKMRLANQKRAANNDPNALTAPLTPKTLGQQVQASTNLEFGDAERNLASQQQQAQQTAASIPSWFQQYQAALQNATDQTKAAYAAAAAGQQNAVNSTYGLDQAAWQKQQGQMAQGAAISGTQLDPALAQQAQQAALSRRQAGDTQTGLTYGLGATQTAYRGGQQVVGAERQVQAQQQQDARIRGLGRDAGALALKKGDYATTTRQKLIDSEHTKQLENKAFGLDVQRVANDASQSAASLAERQAEAAQRAADAAAARQTRASIAAADRASREREGHLTRLTRKKVAAEIQANGGLSPTESRNRSQAVADLETARKKAVNAAVNYVKVNIKDPSTLRQALEEDFPRADPVVIDYALAAALGRKAKVSKPGGPTAAQRYRQHLQLLATGKLKH